MGIFGKSKAQKDEEAKRDAAKKAHIAQMGDTARGNMPQPAERRQPLISIEKVETVSTRGDESSRTTEYRIHTRTRDVISFSSAELKSLFVEIVKKSDAADILHLLWLAHQEQHEEGERRERPANLAGMSAFLKREAGIDLDEIIRDAEKGDFKVAGIKVIDLRDKGNNSGRRN